MAQQINPQDIEWRMRNSGDVSPQEIIALMEHDHADMLDFMILNNPANVNTTVKYTLGYSMLPFTPDPKKIRGQVQAMIAKNDSKSIQTIFDHFRYDPQAKNFTGNAKLVPSLKQQYPTWFGLPAIPQEVQIGGVHCVYYGVGEHGEPVYNCNGALKNLAGMSYGKA